MIKLSREQVEFLTFFEKELNPQQPEKNNFNAKIIGFGEMSTVFSFENALLAGVVFKRMPLFETQEEAEKYRRLYLEYPPLLKQRGLTVPDYGCEIITGNDNKPVLFLSQKRLDGQLIGNKLLQQLSKDEAIQFFKAVLKKLDTFYKQNQVDPVLLVGLDAQLSNWIVTNYDFNKQHLPEDIKLSYLDTNTPLICKQGIEQLDSELFLRICPAILVWVIRRFFLDDIVTRYYDIRLVLIDIIANLYKEQQERLITVFIEVANTFLKNYWSSHELISAKDVKNYYKEDALIWRIFLAFRKLERFWRVKLCRQNYKLILPDKIKR